MKIKASSNSFLFNEDLSYVCLRFVLVPFIVLPRPSRHDILEWLGEYVRRVEIYLGFKRISFYIYSQIWNGCRLWSDCSASLTESLTMLGVFNHLSTCVSACPWTLRLAGVFSLCASFSLRVCLQTPSFGCLFLLQLYV